VKPRGPDIQTEPAISNLDVRSDLLSPVTGNTAANCEDPEAFRWEDVLRVGAELQVRVECGRVVVERAQYSEIALALGLPSCEINTLPHGPRPDVKPHL